MVIHITCDQCRNLFLHLQISLFQLIKSLILLVHSHKFIIRPFLLQIFSVDIILFFLLYRPISTTHPLPMNALL